jgi:glycerophosphoryl diester phosphodiesterase
MVFHDAMLERLTPERGPLASRPSLALRSIHYRGSEDRILSLADLLELVQGQVPLVIEVKSKWDGGGAFEANIAKALETYAGPVAIMSFDPQVVARFRSLVPRIPRGLIAESFSDEHHWSALSAWRRFAMRNLLYAFSVRPDFIAYDIRSLPALAPAIARRLFGLPLLTWTVRTEAEWARAGQCADVMIFEGFLPGPNG